MDSYGEAFLRLLDTTGRYRTGEIRGVPDVNIDQVRAEYRKQYEDQKLLAKCDLSIIKTTSSSSPAFACTKPLKFLQRIGIKDLVIYEWAKGKYLLVRILEPPYMLVGVRMVVEDPFGKLVGILLYNYVDYNSKLPVEDVLPVGSVYIIKEPFLKISQSSEIAIRCDCPSDFIRVDRNHEMCEVVSKIKWKNKIDSKYITRSLCKDAVEWKAEGNRLFKEGKFRDALEAYLVALKVNTDQSLNVVLQLNASAACLHLQRYEDGLIHSNIVLESGNENVKALYRAGRAHYGLRQFKEALQMFERLLKVEPKNNDAHQELKRCEQRVKEQEGYVDVYNLYQRSKETPGMSIEFGEYIGPIEIAQIKGKHRGIVASKDIKSGTILLASKAFQVSFETNSVAAMSISSGKMDHGSKVKLLADTCQAVMNNPHTFGKSVYSLRTNDPEFDQGFQVFCDEDNKTEPICNSERLRKVLQHNCLGLHHTCSKFLSYPEVTGSGLFILASYFNHSCVPNAWQVNYNDVIVIRSTKHIPKGNEITIGNQECMFDFPKREIVHSNTGYRCKCALCKLDRKESSVVHQKRVKLTQAQKELCQKYALPERGNAKFRRDMKRIIQELEVSYGPRITLRHSLFDPYMRLAEAVEDKRTCSSEKIELVEKALRSLGLSCEHLLKWAVDEEYSLPDSSILIPLQIQMVASLMNRQFVELRPWAKVLVKLEMIFCGNNVPLMKDHYKADPVMLDLLTN